MESTSLGDRTLSKPEARGSRPNRNGEKRNFERSLTIDLQKEYKHWTVLLELKSYWFFDARLRLDAWGDHYPAGEEPR